MLLELGEQLKERIKACTVGRSYMMGSVDDDGAS
jgi:hypothetical protein